MAAIRTYFPWDGPAARRALLLALAATLAFSAAALLHVRNPYWAAMPVWVITQPARGILFERAVFRIAGTLVGAAAGFALVHLPIPSVALLALLALWIAVNAGAAHLLRGVHSYGALLAGMTAALVVIPSLVSPANAMPIATARVACTLIGVLAASAVMAFQTPEAPLAAFYEEVRTVSAEAVSYAARVLGGQPVDDGREERRILGHISQLDHSARLHAAGSVAGYRRQGDVDLLVLGSLTVMAAARAARDGGARFGADLPERLRAIAGHLRGAWTQPLPEDQRRLPFPGGAGMAAGEPPSEGPQDASLLRLEAGLQEVLAADQALALPDSPRAYPEGPRPARLAPHREWNLAWRQGALAFAASFAALCLAQRAGSPTVGLLALGVCIFVMVLGSMPLPQLIAPTLISGVALGVLAAIFYRLAVQPHLATPAGVILSFLPFVLMGGFFRTHPRFGAAGIDFNMCFLLASQAGMPASPDVHRILLDSGALVIAAGLMATLFMLLPHRAPGQVQDAAALIRRDLQRILEGGANPDLEQWRSRSSRQILRLALHLGRARDLGRRWPRGLLAALNLGHALIDLQAQGVPEPAQAMLAATFRGGLAPREAAQGLRDLAGAGARTGPWLRRLAETLDQAHDLLTFEHP